jgi:hypothetical protein
MLDPLEEERKSAESAAEAVPQQRPETQAKANTAPARKS